MKYLIDLPNPNICKTAQINGAEFYKCLVDSVTMSSCQYAQNYGNSLYCLHLDRSTFPTEEHNPAKK